MGLRIGNGFDVHRFSEDPARVLVLGGVRFDGEPALHGHSDADVISHAVGEALLDAADAEPDVAAVEPAATRVATDRDSAPGELVGVVIDNEIADPHRAGGDSSG